MANYCSNCIAFFGNDLDKLEHLRKMMDTTFNLSEYGSIRDFVMSYGYAKEEAINFTDGRDSFIEVDFEVTKDDESYYFTIQTESAWNPNVEVFRKVITDHYEDEIDFVHCSEEPGFAVYVNTDTTGRFYEDKYHLDYCVQDKYVMEYFISFNDVINALTEDFPELEFSIYDSVDEINDRVQTLLENSKDDYFNLYEYTEE